MPNTGMYHEMRFSSGPTAIQTIGAVTVTLIPIDLSAFLPNTGNIPLHCEAILLAQDNAAGTCATGRILRSAKYNAGSLSLPGNGIPLAAFDGDLVSVVSAILTLSGTTLRLQGTGVAAVTINWWAFLKFWSAGFAG